MAKKKRNTRSGTELFTSVLEFANRTDLPSRLSKQDSEKLRRDLRFSAGAYEIWPDVLVNFDKLRWKQNEPRAVRDLLVQILKELMSKGPTRRRGKYLQQQVEAVPMTASPRFRERRGEYFNLATAELVGSSPTYELSTVQLAHPRTLEQWCSMAVARIIVHGVTLRRCKLESCQNFFVNWKSRGPEKKYCSESCGGQFRVKRHRRLKRGQS